MHEAREDGIRIRFFFFLPFAVTKSHVRQQREARQYMRPRGREREREPRCPCAAESSRKSESLGAASHGRCLSRVQLRRRFRRARVQNPKRLTPQPPYAEADSSREPASPRADIKGRGVLPSFDDISLPPPQTIHRTNHLTPSASPGSWKILVSSHPIPTDQEGLRRMGGSRTALRERWRDGSFPPSGDDRRFWAVKRVLSQACGSHGAWITRLRWDGISSLAV